MERVIGARVDGEPIGTIHYLLAIGSKLWKQVLIAPLSGNVGDAFAIGFHDLVILVVYPNAPLEISFLAFDLFGCDVEHIAVEVVLLLLPDIENAVFPNLITGQHKRQPVLNSSMSCSV